MVDEVAAATASITQPPEENVVPSVTLEHCAEQILNGIKREVEVQYLVPMNVQNNSSQKTNQVQSDEQACIEKETGLYKFIFLILKLLLLLLYTFF